MTLPSSDGPKFHAFGKFLPAFQEFLTEKQIAAQWFQHMLPGPGGLGIANLYLFILLTARIMSGISRSAAQSPPPMTFPARALARSV